ncbi:MAG: Rne/Rng family ribonuclease [Acidobacteriota bacterium]
MTTRMLINAQRAEQVRVAIVHGNELKDYQVEITDRNLCRGNIYRGIVANIQPSLAAAFIDIGEDRHGFLPVADVQPAAYHRQPPEDVKRPRIDQVLERGKPILVQATKDSGGTKGAALSTSVALAGRYLVLTPFDDVSGISRKAEDDKSRKKIRQRLSKLNLPDGHGVIVRTNGIEQNQTTLSRDLNALLRMWKRVNTEYKKGRGSKLIYSDQDLIVQALRDYLDSSIAEVIVDDDSVYEKARTYMRAFMPRSKTSLIRYEERLPLFTRYRIEPQIETIYERSAPLPSGGSIVIDATEALTAIDVNSGRATQRGDHDESILNVNIEAAHEVARQLRLRDIGGLVVVDFIDMRTRRHQSKLEKVMRDAMKVDKARYSVGRISPNGLLEINRQRIKQALHQRTHRPCPTCFGAGTVPSAEFAAATLLGKIEARVAPGLIERVTVAVHPEIADALQNQHRARLAALEAEFQLHIEIISATNFKRSEERIDYQQRENAIVPKPVAPALSSSDLAAGGQAAALTAQDAAEEADSPPEKKTRKRRRRRKTKAQKEAEARAENAAEAPEEEAEEPKTKGRGRGRSKTKEQAKAKGKAKEQATDRAAGKDQEAEASEATEEAVDAQTESAEGEDSTPSKPSRSRRRRRGGRRTRRSSSQNGDAAAPPPEAQAPAHQGDALDWNAGLVDSPGPAGDEAATESAPAAEASSNGDQETSKPRRRRRSRRSRKPATDEDAQPTHDGAWQSALGQPHLSAEPEDTTQSRRSPLRRDRSSTLRWQWWGGDESEPNVGGELPAIFKDTEEA